MPEALRPGEFVVNRLVEVTLISMLKLLGSPDIEEAPTSRSEAVEGLLKDRAEDPLDKPGTEETPDDLLDKDGPLLAEDSENSLFDGLVIDPDVEVIAEKVLEAEEPLSKIAFVEKLERYPDIEDRLGIVLGVGE